MPRKVICKLRFDDAALALLRLHETHAQLVQQVVHETRFGFAEVALGLLLQERDELDHLRGAGQVRLDSFSGAGIGDIAEMDGRGRGEREDEASERDRLGFLILHHGMLAYRANALRRCFLTCSRRVRRLVDIMRRLRGPGGCPWDHEQTIHSLRGFVLEETYEVLDAIDRGDHAALLGEIGDLIFEGVFLARIEEDDGHFAMADSLQVGQREVDPASSTRIRRRQPSPKVATAGKVVEQWEQIKAREQQSSGERRSLLKGVPKSMPSLLRAHEIGTRVAAVGFDWPGSDQVVDKIEEEVGELRSAIRDNEGRERAEEEMGDLLFSIANLSRKLGIEPESALRKANEKFSARFEALEQEFERQGRAVQDATLEELEEVWGRIKGRLG